MINLKKIWLVEDTAKVFGHFWSSISFCALNVNKIQALTSKTDDELGRMLRPWLRRLLNWEHILVFAELVKPLQRLLR